MPIPTRNSRTALVQKIIDRINRMDEVSFSRFVDLIVKRLHQDNTIQNENIDEIVTLLGQIKARQEDRMNYKDYDIKFPSIDNPPCDLPSINFPCTFGIGYPLWCIIWFMEWLLKYAIGILLVIIYEIDLFITSLLGCDRIF
jgi:hypothetical protein